MSAEEKPKEKWRANYVGAPGYLALNHCCKLINDAFDGFGCYLVGSSLERRDFRDVDVRFIMDDEAYKKLFRDENGWLNPLWTLLCLSISVWLRQQTGLPVDFQIQSQTQANRDHPGAGRRNPLGLFLDYPGERPTDVQKEQP